MTSRSVSPSTPQSGEFGEQPLSPRSSPSGSPRTSAERNIGEMIIKSIKGLKQPDGCGLAQIKKYMSSKLNVDTASVTPRIKSFLKKATTDGTLSQAKGKYKVQRKRRRQKSGGKKKTGARRRRSGSPKKKGKKAAKKKGPSRSKKGGGKKKKAKKAKKAKKGRGRRQSRRRGRK